MPSTFLKCITPMMCAAISGIASIPRAYAAQASYSSASTGFLGLNTIPSARMDKAGTLRAGVSILDPYLHGYIGVQIADPLSITLRQTAEISNITHSGKALYPGIDFKLRLVNEGKHHPALALGMQSAFGHKRMAGEYLAFSKRYSNFDFTGGLGWGRFGTAGHLDNPLKAISSHFDKDRDPNNKNPNTTHNWFTGDKIGFFAGLEYFTPYDGLSIKLDYGADRYRAEQQSFNYDAGAPWAIGLAYNHKNWIDASIGMQGTDKVMARMSLHSTPSKWPFAYKQYNTPQPFYNTRNLSSDITALNEKAEREGINLSNIETDNAHFYADIDIPEHITAPQHIGRAARLIAHHAGPKVEEINLTMRQGNLSATQIKIMRSDLEKSLNNNHGSPQEIWRNTEFNAKRNSHPLSSHLLPKRGIDKSITYTLRLDNQFSLSEEDRSLLYRSSIVTGIKATPFLGFLFTGDIRINMADNLSAPNTLPPNPARSDIDSFTNTVLSIDSAYIGYTHSFTPTLHSALSAGYLEEMYRGVGGEILYRPIASRFAIGTEGWLTQKRKAGTTLNLGTTNNIEFSGHINTWYDIPKHDITASLSAGRYLGEDFGASIGLEKRFENGVRLTGDLTISNDHDPDTNGGTTHAYHSINLSMPLGGIPYIPEGSEMRTTIAPFGRDAGQRIQKPIDLYGKTESFTIDHMAKYWNNILL